MQFVTSFNWYHGGFWRFTIVNRELELESAHPYAGDQKRSR